MSLQSLQKLFARSLAVFLALLCAAAVSAWTGPTAAPPGNNVAAPLNEGSATQTKSGALTVSGAFSSGTRVTSPEFCIGGSCITAWPSGGGGGDNLGNQLADNIICLARAVHHSRRRRAKLHRPRLLGVLRLERHGRLRSF